MAATLINASNFTMELLNTDYMKMVFRFELFKVKEQDKEDVKQDCIVRILKALKKQEVPVEKLPFFCQTIIRRTVLDYYRRKNRMIDQKTMLVFFCDRYGDEEGDVDEVITFAHECEDYGYVLSDIRADFEKNRNKFTPTEQNVIEYMLYNQKGLSMNLSEIAAELQVNKSNTTKAFKKLREICGA